MATLLWFYFELFGYILWALMITYSIYSTIKTRRNESNLTTWMKKRNIVVFYALNTSCICCISAFLFTASCWVHASGHILTISNITWTVSIFIWMSVLLTKNWAIYYRYKWTQYIQISKWQQIINPHILEHENIINWFIRNNSTYGQTKYIHNLFVSVATCCSVVLSFIWFFTSIALHHAIHMIISCVCTLFLFVPAVILYVFLVWNTPVLDDIFQIHWESKAHAKLLCATIPAPPICTLYYILTSDRRSLFVACLLSSIAIFFMVFVSTVYIPNKLNPKHPNTRNIVRVMSITSESITLEMVLSNDTTLNLFMNHLSSEYSMEILLSCIEIMQYQNYLKPFVYKEEDYDILNLKLPQNIPISEIILSNDIDTASLKSAAKKNHDSVMLQNAKKIAHELYRKYIRELAEFEVNISATMRYGLSEKLEDLDQVMIISNDTITLEALYVLFEECKKEMLQLQSIAYQRFRAEQVFDVVKSVFFAEQK